MVLPDNLSPKLKKLKLKKTLEEITQWVWVWVWVWFRVLVVAAGAEKNIKNGMQTGQKKIEETREEQTREINYLFYKY